jgi:hypothetical protein
MDLDSLGISEMLVVSCGCLVPLVLAVGVVVVLLLVVGRRKPQAAPKKATARKPAPAPKVEPTMASKAEPTPAAKAVTVEEIATKSCASCGADNPADNAFCEYCGASMAEE